MDKTSIKEMIEKKRKEAMEKAEAQKKKVMETAEARIKKIEEKTASIEIDEEKFAKAVVLENKIKEAQEELKALGIKKGRTIGIIRGPRPKSVSNKYPTVRALAEEMFENNPEVKAVEMEAAIKAEFPESRFTKNDFNWLKNKILYHGEWKTRGKTE